MRTWLTILVVGALGGTLLDQLHVQGHVLRYAHPLLAGQAAWVPPEFGVAVLVIVLATRQHLRAWHVHPGARPGRQVAVDAAWFVAAYVATATVGDHDVAALAAAMVGLWLLRLALAPRPLHLLVFGLALGAGGTGFEALLSHTGAFTYEHPSAWGVPAWLPMLYMHGVPLACSLVGLALPVRRPAAGDQPPATTASRRDAMLPSSSP